MSLFYSKFLKKKIIFSPGFSVLTVFGRLQYHVETNFTLRSDVLYLKRSPVCHTVFFYTSRLKRNNKNKQPPILEH